MAPCSRWGDPAGLSAASRGLDLAFTACLALLVLSFPLLTASFFPLLVHFSALVHPSVASPSGPHRKNCWFKQVGLSGYHLVNDK